MVNACLPFACFYFLLFTHIVCLLFVVVVFFFLPYDLEISI